MKSIHYGILGFTTVLAALSPEMAAALEKIGVVGLAGTTVTATGEDGTARVLKTGDDVFLGDHVVSDAGGKAQLIFMDRSTLTLNANTDLTLDKYVYDPAAATGTMGVSSVKGAFRFVGGVLSKKQPVTIKTPVATIGIRGGIADTNVDGGSGASDAVFVYGEELTMTNESGNTFSTTQVGTGLMLDTPTGTPQPMPQNLINQRMQSFGTPSPESGDNGTTGGENGASNNSGGTSGESTASSNSGGSSSGGGASGGGTTVQFVNNSGESVGAPVTFFDNGADIAGNTSQSSTNEKIKVALVNGDNSVLPGVNTLPQVNKAPLPPQNTDTVLLPPAGLPGGDEGGQSNVTVQTDPTPAPQPNPTPSSSGGGSTPPAPMLRGRYFHYDAAASDFAKGTVESTIPAGNPLSSKATFTETSRQNVSAILNDFASVNGDITLVVPNTSLPGANYGSPGAASLLLDVDGNTVNGNEATISGGKYYQTPDDAFRQYYFSNGGDPLAFYQGLSIFGENTSLDSSRLSEAMTRSRGVSATEGFEGISFYTFLPDIGKYPGGSGDVGMLDYSAPHTTGTAPSYYSDVVSNLSGSTVGSEHLRTGPGLMVDWQKGRFLTQNVEFIASGGSIQEPSATLGAGAVNSGGPNFLDGRIQHFEGEKYGTAATTDSTDYAYGTVKVGREIYGNPTGRIEALVTNMEVTKQPLAIPASYIQTTVGSSLIHVTVAGSDITVGDHVTISGLGGAVNGIPAASLNGHEFVVSSIASGIATIDVGVQATAAGSGGTAFTMIAHETGSQAAVLDNAHGLNATNFDSTRDIDHGGQRTGDEMRGFAGGLVKHVSGANKYFSAQTSSGDTSGDKITDVVIAPNLSAGGIQSSSHVNVDLRSGSGPASVDGTFGGTDSAYMNNRHYGAVQTSATVGGNSATTSHGFITTATEDKTITQKCTNCEYTHWGVWATNVSDGTDKYTVEMMPYVAGQVTQNFDAAKASALDAATGNTGVANYTGATYGSFTDGTYVKNLQASMSAQVDLANRTVNDLQLNYGTVFGQDMNLHHNGTAVNIADTGDAVFQNIALQNTGASVTGSANGALFGPNAEEIGGNFNASGTGIDAAGIYQGRR